MRITDWFKNLPPKQQERVPYLLLALAVFAAYANVYHNPFLLDDLPLIAQNELLRSWDSLPQLLTGMTAQTMGFYRPVQMLVYFFTYQLFGPSMVAFHALNVILQAANVALMFRLGCRLGFRPLASFMAALLWGVHPLWTEAVTAASGTADLLFGFFALAGLLVLLPDFAPKKFRLAALFLVLALGSKESAVVFPALATCTLFLVSKERLRFATYIRTWPIWLLAIVYAAGMLLFYDINTNYVLYDHSDTEWVQLYANSIINRILTCFATIPAYIGLFVWPAHLHMDRDRFVATAVSWDVLAGALVTLAVLAQIFYGRGKRVLALSWGFLWAVVAYAPNTGIAVPVNAVIAEHWMYLPAIGLFLGLAQTAIVYLDALKLKNIPVLACGLAVGVALLLGIKTHCQNRIWHDQIAFYENVLAGGSHSGRAHVHLSLFYSARGEFEKAITHAEEAVRHPAPLSQSMLPGLYIDLALMYLHARPENTESGRVTMEEVSRVLPSATRIPDAVEAINKALELDPGMRWAQELLEVMHGHQGQNVNTNLYEEWVARSGKNQ